MYRDTIWVVDVKIPVELTVNSKMTKKNQQSGVKIDQFFFLPILIILFFLFTKPTKTTTTTESDKIREKSAFVNPVFRVTDRSIQTTSDYFFQFYSATCSYYWLVAMVFRWTFLT